jgi:hypothetical protein
MAQRFSAPVRGPDCALWTAQSFELRSTKSHSSSSYKEGYWGKIGAISSISPQFHAEILEVEVVGRQQNLRAILGRRHWHTCLFLLQPQQL